MKQGMKRSLVRACMLVGAASLTLALHPVVACAAQVEAGSTDVYVQSFDLDTGQNPLSDAVRPNGASDDNRVANIVLVHDLGRSHPGSWIMPQTFDGLMGDVGIPALGGALGALGLAALMIKHMCGYPVRARRIRSSFPKGGHVS